MGKKLKAESTNQSREDTRAWNPINYLKLLLHRLTQLGGFDPIFGPVEILATSMTKMQ